MRRERLKRFAKSENPPKLWDNSSLGIWNGLGQSYEMSSVNLWRVQLHTILYVILNI